MPDQNAVPYFIASPNPQDQNPVGSIDVWGSASSFPIGLPQDQQSQLPPSGLESTVASVSSPPPLASIGAGVWDTIKQDAQSATQWAENAASNVYQGTKKVASTVYGDLSSGVGTVVNDVTAPVRQTYWYLILAVIVIGGVVYFAGKSGAIKVHAVV